MPSLDYTGHPFFDVGLAAIVALVEKLDPTELTWADLDTAANYIDTYYTEQPLMSFLTVSLPNSDFTNPAFRDKPERRHAYGRRVARSFGPDIPVSDEQCAFTGLPALALPLSVRGEDDLPPGRAYRQHIPLITSENTINFSAWGDPGLPVSGEAILCLQFFPMGCRKCGGRLLAVHSDNRRILLGAAQEALQENRKAITLAKANGETKLPNASPSAQTLLVETLLQLNLQQFDALEERQSYSITAYHLTNSGQTSPLDDKSPFVQIYSLPMSIIRFLHTQNNPSYQQTWRLLTQQGWERPKPSKSKKGDVDKEGNKGFPSERRRNYLYEDIFRLPENARSFVRTYLLRSPKRTASQIDPRNEYSMRKDIELVSWQFTEMFLKEVMHMDKERIEEIRHMGDRFAAYVMEQEDKRFFRKFYEVQRPDDFRTELLRVNKNYAMRGKTPLLSLDSFCTVFFEEDGNALRLDWKFARDLVFIRMIEWLHTNNNWLSKHPDALPDTQDTNDAPSDNG